MTYFMNPFNEDFYGNWVIDDRHHHPTFKCPRNSGRGDELVVSWAAGPYDLSSTDGDGDNESDLTIQFSMDTDRLVWVKFTVDVTAGAGSSAAVTPAEVVTALNNNATFSTYFTATLERWDVGGLTQQRPMIRQKMPITRMKFFIVKGGAETVLKFNARAGVAELPTYFERHTVFNTGAGKLQEFSDGVNMLIALDPSNDGSGGSAVDNDIIDNAVDAKGNSLGLDSSSVQPDWQLLGGQSFTFKFTKVVGASADDDSTRIEFPAGAKVGDLAKKIITEVDSSGFLVNEFIMPHTLTSSDLITPP